MTTIENKEQETVVPKKRKSRRKCYGSDDPNHVCSVNHVRVPAHCRLKRFKKKKQQKEISNKTKMPTLRTFSDDPAFNY